MIKTKINTEFPHHTITQHSGDVYVADYTEQTKSNATKRGTEIFDNPPTDIEYFSVYNPNGVKMGNVVFDNQSFRYPNGNSKSQCESCLFPFNSNQDSWVLFAELKYANTPKRNKKHFEKAIKQLYKTRYHYLERGIFDKKNNCYLLISMPRQQEPFPNFNNLTPARIADLKKKHKITLRATNSVKVKDDKYLEV
ncbi:hypothetical protein [Capnocytophaga canis]|uniref:Restriction endonuclease n=1 Tax=Capnocytophaga canis TaxID=1848903 RepID=A0A0B7IK86_9FLAO|nr:hypothetical protein [Capnocytophaga canis]CEN50427.1 conserved hypothetical protein [Capnocytophaga canis]